MKNTKSTAGLVALVISGTLLAGCGSGTDTAEERPAAATTQSDKTSSKDEKAAATTEQVAAEPVQAGAAPAWATGVVTVGEVIETLDVDGLSVELRNAGTKPATQTGELTDGTLLYSQGDPIQFVSVTVTNASGGPIELGSALVDLQLAPEGWKYVGGVPGEAQGGPYTELGLIRNPIADFQDSYPLAAGESFSFAVSSPHADTQTAEITWRGTDWSDVHGATTTVTLG